jgi:cell division protease FtsH
MMGAERKSMIMQRDEKELTAYHEAGHAIVAINCPNSDPIHKATIIPRGRSLGMVMRLPERDQFSITRVKLHDDLAVAMGGRAAEEIIFGKISTGALSDLERITKMAYSMVSVYGMNEKLGNVSFYDSKSDGYKMTKPFSEATAEIIDQEVSKLIQHAYTRVLDLLRKHQAELEILAKELLEKEILFQADLERLIGKRPFEKETTYQAFTNKKEPILAEPAPEVAEGTEKEDAAEALPPTPDAAAEETKTEA